MQVSRVSRVLIAAGLALGCGFPAAGQSRGSDDDAISTIRYPMAPYVRDSDGDVISVIEFGHHGGRPVVYHLTDTDGRDPYIAIMAYRGGDALPATVSANGTTYRVETSGGEVFLHPEGSNRRLRAVRVEAAGERVNPTAFALK